MIDFRSGLAEEKEDLSLFRSINEEQTIDRETNTLEFIYNLHPTKTGSVPSLEETTIQINGITAYRTSDPKTYSIFKGEWELPIDTSKINYFDEINFTPKIITFYRLSEQWHILLILSFVLKMNKTF